MEMFDGELNPDLKSGTFRSGNVSIKIAAKGGATLALSPEQIQVLGAKIRQQLAGQSRRDKRRDDGEAQSS